MIFVTVGTDEHDFSRLIKEVDKIAPKIDDDFIVQLGYTKYEPENCDFFHFTSLEKIEELNKKSDIIITHAGAGSIIKALKRGKKPIVVPRRKKYNEHINDHQLDLMKKMSSAGKIIPCKKPDKLKSIIDSNIFKESKSRVTEDKENLILILKKILGD